MVAAALLAVGAPKPAKAANLFWDTNSDTAGIGGAGAWDTAATNWFNANAGTTATGLDVTSAYTFTANDYAYFTGTGASVSLGADITLGGLVFAGVTTPTLNSYAISGANKLTLATPSGARSPSVPSRPVIPSRSVACGDLLCRATE